MAARELWPPTISKGSALLVIEGAKSVHLADFSIDGNRGQLAKPFEMAPPENAFRIWYPLNGILADQVEGLRIERIDITSVVHFPILISRSSSVRIQDVNVTNSGALNAKGRNNLSGGILLEEGTSDFEVKKIQLQKYSRQCSLDPLASDLAPVSRGRVYREHF